MKRTLLLTSALCLAAAACARPDTVYVAHGAAHTPRIELADGHAIEPRPMPGDTLTAGGVCFVRLPRLRLVLCIGQSNMAGRGPMDAGAADTLRGVYLFNDSARFERAAEPMNRYSTVRKELGMQRIGPVGSFAARYAEVTERPGGRRGQRPRRLVDRRVAARLRNGLSGQAVERIRAAGDWGDFTAVLWHQGEADSAHPERYGAKLRRLVAILRTELGNPSLPVVFGEIAHWNWTNRAEGTAPFNAMLRNLRIPHTACVSAEGLAPMKDETDPHFSAASQRELGRRYAEALLKIR